MADDANDRRSDDPPSDAAGSPKRDARDIADIGQQQFIHGLLTTHHESDQQRQQRIGRALARFNAEDNVGTPRRRWFNQPVIAMAGAAVVLLVLSVWVLVPSRPAEAALAQTIATLDQPTIRTYRVIMTGRLGRKPFRREVLFSTHSRDDFLVSIPASARQPALVGGNATGQWTIFGDRVWSSSDSDAPPGGMFLNALVARQMNLNRLLTEIPEHYQTQTSAQESIPGRPDLVTVPVVATHLGQQRRLPRWIKVWPHPESGVAVRMEMRLPRTFAISDLHHVVALLIGQEPYDPTRFLQSEYLKGTR